MKGDIDFIKTARYFQRTELTESIVYRILARLTKGKNRKMLLRISSDEKKHYLIWKKYTKEDVLPMWWRIWMYGGLSCLFGLSFTGRLMEKNERRAEEKYKEFVGKVKEAEKILREEQEHEDLLLSLIDEKRLYYISSMVLGLNDALVELSGTLAGLSFALQNTRLVGLAGIITGVAASLSMASAEYLSQKADDHSKKNPLIASIFTGSSYIITVILLVFPYFVFDFYLYALVVSIFMGILSVIVFSFFVAVVKDKSFSSLFKEMIFLNGFVILVSFAVGIFARRFLGVDL